MKILLLGFGKIAYMPYMNFYLDAFKNRSDIELDLIYWDRDGKPDVAIPSRIRNAYKFEAYLEEQLPIRKKMFFFLKYRIFAMRLLAKNHYDFIILLHTTPGLTVLNYLRRHYNNRYILDFRDISHEYNSFYRRLVEKLAETSALTFVSSNAYRRFLPDLPNIYTIHNYLEESLQYNGIRSLENRNKGIIKISYWGLIRHVTVNKKIIDALGNDPRFELHYYGRMQQDGRDIQEYTQNKKYKNVFFHGQYMPSDRYEFAKQTDLIHNLYDRDNIVTTNAMGNKFYDGVIFHIPQICIDGSYMGELVTKHKVGIELDMDESEISKKIWEYYNQIDWRLFDNNCEEILEEIVREQDLARKKLVEVIE